MLLLDKFIMDGETLEICDLFSRTKIGEIISNLSAKQNITDNALATNAKTIVGAINEINSDLSVNTTTQTFSNAQFDITATTKYINAHVAECNIYFEFKQALSSGRFDITLTGLTKLPMLEQQRTAMLGTSMLFCALTPSGDFIVKNNSGTTMEVGYSENVTFNYMFI